MKQRLDVLLVEQGLAASREKAKAMIMSGVVFVNGQREDKAGSTLVFRSEKIFALSRAYSRSYLNSLPLCRNQKSWR